MLDPDAWCLTLGHYSGLAPHTLDGLLYDALGLRLTYRTLYGAIGLRLAPQVLYVCYDLCFLRGIHMREDRLAPVAPDHQKKAWWAHNPVAPSISNPARLREAGAPEQHPALL